MIPLSTNTQSRSNDKFSPYIESTTIHFMPSTVFSKDILGHSIQYIIDHFDKQHEKLVNLKLGEINISDNTNVFKETTTKFSSEIIEQEKQMYYLIA